MYPHLDFSQFFLVCDRVVVLQISCTSVATAIDAGHQPIIMRAPREEGSRRFIAFIGRNMFTSNFKALCNFTGHCPFFAGSCASAERHAVSEMERKTRRAYQTDDFATARDITKLSKTQL